MREHRRKQAPRAPRDARAGVVSCSDRQLQRFALTLVVNVAGLWREHERKRVEDVLPRFLARAALAEDARHLGDRNDDPAVLPRLVDDRQIQRVVHAPSVAHAHAVPPRDPSLSEPDRYRIPTPTKETR